MTAKAVCTRRQTQLGWPYAHSYIPENSECRAVGASWWFRSCIGSTALVESFCFRSLVQVPSLVTSSRLPPQLAADDTGLSALTCSRSDWLLAFAAFVLIWNANRTSPSGFAGGSSASNVRSHVQQGRVLCNAVWSLSECGQRIINGSYICC